ncbi:MAG: hypothetical protein ACETWO_01970 [Candidatus Hadarchaeaceae archaeon]
MNFINRAFDYVKERDFVTGKIEDMVADLIAELRHRLGDLERRVASLELSLEKVQPPKRASKIIKSKRRSR